MISSEYLPCVRCPELKVKYMIFPGKVSGIRAGLSAFMSGPNSTFGSPSSLLHLTVGLIMGFLAAKTPKSSFSFWASRMKFARLQCKQNVFSPVMYLFILVLEVLPRVLPFLFGVPLLALCHHMLLLSPCLVLCALPGFHLGGWQTVAHHFFFLNIISRKIATLFAHILSATAFMLMWQSVVFITWPLIGKVCLSLLTFSPAKDLFY